MRKSRRRMRVQQIAKEFEGLVTARFPGLRLLAVSRVPSGSFHIDFAGPAELDEPVNDLLMARMIELAERERILVSVFVGMPDVSWLAA